MDKQTIIQNIFNTLGSQRFADWYNGGGNFDKWIMGELDAPTAEQIKKEIEQLFNIKN